MAVLKKVLFSAGPLALLLLTALAGYAYSQIRFLNLPISKALALFTLVLPIITGITTHGSYGLVRRISKRESYQLTIPFIAIIGFQLIYETIVATLALTYILPPSALNCGLQERWRTLYRSKDAEAITAIQDALNCCGLSTVKDMAFPFTKNAASNCVEIYGRTQSCIGPWRKAQQMNAGWLLLIAIVVFIVKVLAILSLLTNSHWSNPTWMRRLNGSADAEEPEDNRATMRRLIEENANDESYHDDVGTESTPAVNGAPNGENDQRPRVQPSQLVEHGNEWRDEGVSASH